MAQDKVVVNIIIKKNLDTNKNMIELNNIYPRIIYKKENCSQFWLKFWFLYMKTNNNF